MRTESHITVSELDTFSCKLKAIDTSSILLSGKRFKEYKLTDITFTKGNIWPEKYQAELRGIEIARRNNITVPEITEHSLGEWGSITYKYISAPRLDRTAWFVPEDETIYRVGSTLAHIHQIKLEEEPNEIIFPRRYKYFLDDMRRRSKLPEDCFKIAESAFSQACMLVHQNCELSFVHGDYSLQNIFDTVPLTVFDWEYSHFGYGLFDIGTCLSDMVFAVTEGNWNFGTYFRSYQTLIDGYKSVNSNIETSREAISAFRFLGHRVPPQFYLFSIEKFAILDNNGEVKQILDGQRTPEESIKILKKYGIEMDGLWGNKVLTTLSYGGYRPDFSFWEWVRRYCM